MIVVTGAAGFIGSALIAKLNSEHYLDIIAVDDFSSADKNKNLEGKKLSAKINRDTFFGWLQSNHRQVEFIYHLGARTDTTEFDTELLNRLNLNYSKEIWKACTRYGIPLIYASSAATYGSGEHGYSDDEAIIEKLHPLNPYGVSKNEFDKWALAQDRKPYFWMGFKFFNVYGSNEYHKGRMASVVFHAYNQIKASGKMKLFRSHRPDFKDGEQMRDFIYVKDVTAVLYSFLHKRNPALSGIYNLGSGKAETFKALAEHTFNAMEIPVNIEYIDTPEDIRDKYQYFTEAEMDKLRRAEYENPFTPLAEGISDYVKAYLSEHRYL